MRTTSEAPVAEPQPVERAASPAAGGSDRRGDGGARIRRCVEIEGLAHAFGELRVIERLDLSVRSGEVAGRGRPLGLRQVDPAGADQRPARAQTGAIEVGGAGSASRAPRPLRLHAAARPAASVAGGDRQRGAGAAKPRGLARRGAPAAHPLFERFGLAGFERSRPAELSGGMRQRIAFLRTLLAGKPVLLLDEPFASLDAITRAEMQEWLAEALAAESRTVVLVTHDVEEALYLSDRVAVLSARARARRRRARRAPAPGPAAPRRRHLRRASPRRASGRSRR